MKRMFAAAVLGLVMLTSACAFLPDNDATSDAKMAVKAALVTYTKVYQPAVITYGRLPLCPQAAPVCHDGKVFAKLASADAAVRTTANAANKVLLENYNDPNALQRVMDAILKAQVDIAASGILSNKDQ